MSLSFRDNLEILDLGGGVGAGDGKNVWTVSCISCASLSETVFAPENKASEVSLVEKLII